MWKLLQCSKHERFWNKKKTETRKHMLRRWSVNLCFVNKTYSFVHKISYYCIRPADFANNNKVNEQWNNWATKAWIRYTARLFELGKPQEMECAFTMGKILFLRRAHSSKEKPEANMVRYIKIMLKFYFWTPDWF